MVSLMIQSVTDIWTASLRCDAVAAERAIELQITYGLPGSMVVFRGRRRIRTYRSGGIPEGIARALRMGGDSVIFYWARRRARIGVHRG